VSDEIQALLVTPTTNWDSMSEAGMDMLSDMHLSTMLDPPTVTTGQTTMQVDFNDLTETTDQTLALPQALLRWTTWSTRRTCTFIQALIGTDDNRRCDECKQTFSTMKRLKIHIPQHFTVTFCPCGVHHFYRDAILRHQRTQNCYTEHLYEVDADSYIEFRDLILPHVTDPDHRQTLLDQFPETRPTVESDSDADPQPLETTTTTPALEITIQPLRIIVSRTGRTIGGDSQPPTTTISYLPSRRQKKRKSTSDLTDENISPDQFLLTDVKKLQRRMNLLCKEQKLASLEEQLTKK